MDFHLTTIDWCIVIGVLLCTFLIGLSAAGKAGKSLEDFFIGNRSMPWWLLGVSMVATTFDTNVPNLVTNIVRDNGVSGNWLWLGMAPSGMLTVFVYSRLWRRSGAVTDLEFYELRYSGRLSSFLRGFRAVYLGLGLNVLVMATGILAAIKIGGAMLGLSPLQSVAGAMVITGIFSAAGGLQGVLFSDFLLFILAMSGAFAAAYYSVSQPEVGGLGGMYAKLTALPEQCWKLGLLQFRNWEDCVAMFIVPITIVWWAVWYMGAEPGGGGFMVQRMLAAKNERHAIGATLLFQVAHYALRPWPWFIVALCSLILYPDRESLIASVGNSLPESQIHSDVAYPLMLTRLPPVWAGIMVASLAAAFISTISTLLNWGASYLVHDVYARFLRRDASQRELVGAARVATFVILLLAGLLSFCLRSALDSLNILLSFGAGTGLLYMLRWFWWRINAAAELTAMIAAAVFALYFNVYHAQLFPSAAVSANMALVLSVVATTICWLIPVFCCRGTDKKQLYAFVKAINPPGPGWKAIRQAAAEEGVSLESEAKPAPLAASIWAAVVSCVFIYSILLGVGELIYGQYGRGAIYLAATVISAWATYRLWRRSEA